MKNSKLLFTFLLFIIFGYNLFAQSNETYVNAVYGYNLVFKTNNIQQLVILTNGNVQFSSLTSEGTGLVTYDSSGTIHPISFNGNAATVLTGNGTFASSSSFSPWQQSGSNIYYTGGKVGIGTSDPHYALQIVGNVVDSGSLFATHIVTSNSISVGQFRLVDGVVDSIVSTGGALELSATTINADGALTIGQDSSAIKIDGTTGAITSPSGTVGFGNDTIVTTAAIKAGSFKVNYLKADTIQSNDSILYFGDWNFAVTMSATNRALLHPLPTPWSFPNGTAIVNNATVSPVINCPTFLEVGASGIPDATLNVTGPCSGNYLFSATNTSLGDVFTINQTGQVAIGTGLNTNTTYKYGLYVGNGILTSVVKIALPSDPVNWSDYVFAKNYKLKPLTEVAKYIKENKHLPDVPSAGEVQKDGINVAEMDAILLKKIEELTLYIIQQQKQVDQQKQSFDQQKQLLDQQQQEIQDLKVQLAKLQASQK